MRKLFIVSIVCFLFMGGELIGGIISGSLAIMTDAAHMLSDVASFMISYFAIYMGNRPASFKMSYGFHRAEVLGALASIVLIWGLLIWLFAEAIERLVHPSEIDGSVMLITAVVGLACNIVSIFTLHSWCGGSKEEEEEHEHHHEEKKKHDHHKHAVVHDEEESKKILNNDQNIQTSDNEQNVNVGSKE